MKTKYHYRIVQPEGGKLWQIWHVQTSKLIATRNTRREIRKLKAQLEERLQTALNIAEATDAHASP